MDDDEAQTIAIRASDAQILRLKRELERDIARELGLFDSAGNPDLSQFKHWWTQRKTAEERWGKIGLAIFQALAISGALGIAGYIYANFRWPWQ